MSGSPGVRLTSRSYEDVWGKNKVQYQAAILRLSKFLDIYGSLDQMFFSHFQRYNGRTVLFHKCHRRCFEEEFQKSNEKTVSNNFSYYNSIEMAGILVQRVYTTSVHQMCWGSDFQGWKEILLFGKAKKFRLIFQNMH